MRARLSGIIIALALCVAPASAQQETVTIPSVGPGGVAQLPAQTELRRQCQVMDVAAFTNRVHVRCPHGPTIRSGLYTRDYVPPPQPDTGVLYFAVGASADPALADRVIALASLAVQQNKEVVIFYRTDPAENPPGCLPADCRRLVGIVTVVRP
jgi:hypothetical protein